MIIARKKRKGWEIILKYSIRKNWGEKSMKNHIRKQERKKTEFKDGEHCSKETRKIKREMLVFEKRKGGIKRQEKSEMNIV